jgi:hypothetical protein
MSAILRAGLGWAKLSTAPLAFRPPRGLAKSVAVFGPVATARLRARQFFERLRCLQRKGPAGGGGRGRLPDVDPSIYSYWDDPVLWILMMH